jgi:hypothetical protein
LAKFAFIGIAIKGAIGALRQFIGEIPEIGKTFEIAKGIIMKNLLWPLRQELIPILQKFLNWVRDHRTMFVQWGVVIRNIFVTIKTFLTMVWDFAKNFAKGLIKSLGIKDFTEMINMALLKITAVFIFLDDLLSPFFKSFGAGVGEVIKFVKELADAFVKGFGKGFQMEAITNFFDSIGRLIKNFAGVDASPIGKFFKQWSEIIGNIDASALTATVKLLTNLVDLLDKMLNGKWSTIGKDFLDFFADIGHELSGEKGMQFLGTEINKKFLKSKMGSAYQLGRKYYGKDAEQMNSDFSAWDKGGQKMNDGMITKDGKVIHLNPDDNILAVKNKIPSMKTEASFGDINVSINVTEGNAQQAGTNFGEGLMNKLKDMYNHKLVISGGRF